METTDKRKQQLKAAQAKFKQIKTNVNLVELEEIEARVKKLDTTKSNYIKNFIKLDLEGQLFTLNQVKKLSLWQFIKIKYF